MKLLTAVRKRLLPFLTLFFIAVIAAAAPAQERAANAPSPEAIIEKAVDSLGGDKYLNVKTQIGRGRFSQVRDGIIASFQSFIDVIVYPDKERTEFKAAGIKFVQANTGDSGWVFDGDVELIRDQTEIQLANFKRGMRVSIDNLLRGHWRGEGELSYAGRRPASLGKRNEVVKLTYPDGFAVEFEFAADTGLPQKASYVRIGSDQEEIVEEDRYAQFVQIDGVNFPFIVDRFTGGQHRSRINYESVQFNRTVPDSIFAKPSDIKELKKDLKL